MRTTESTTTIPQTNTNTNNNVDTTMLNAVLKSMKAILDLHGSKTSANVAQRGPDGGVRQPVTNPGALPGTSTLNKIGKPNVEKVVRGKKTNWSGTSLDQTTVLSPGSSAAASSVPIAYEIIAEALRLPQVTNNGHTLPLDNRVSNPQNIGNPIVQEIVHRSKSSGLSQGTNVVEHIVLSSDQAFHSHMTPKNYVVDAPKLPSPAASPGDVNSKPIKFSIAPSQELLNKLSSHLPTVLKSFGRKQNVSKAQTTGPTVAVTVPLKPLTDLNQPVPLVHRFPSGNNQSTVQHTSNLNQQNIADIISDINSMRAESASNPEKDMKQIEQKFISDSLQEINGASPRDSLGTLNTHEPLISVDLPLQNKLSGIVQKHPSRPQAESRVDSGATFLRGIAFGQISPDQIQQKTIPEATMKDGSFVVWEGNAASQKINTLPLATNKQRTDNITTLWTVEKKPVYKVPTNPIIGQKPVIPSQNVSMIASGGQEYLAMANVQKPESTVATETTTTSVITAEPTTIDPEAEEEPLAEPENMGIDGTSSHYYYYYYDDD